MNHLLRHSGHSHPAVRFAALVGRLLPLSGRARAATGEATPGAGPPVWHADARLSAHATRPAGQGLLCRSHRAAVSLDQPLTAGGSRPL